MTHLADAFRAKESRVSRTIVAIDLTDSTAMKERETEAMWLTTYAWFFDMLATTMSEHSGQIVKYLGDGAMAVFPDDNAADAINWAIKVQEGLAEARGDKTIGCACSVGIAYGDVVEFDKADSDGVIRKDYIGTVVDRAFRLCSAANANAVFVDLDTITAAAMNRVQSKVGATAPKRKAAEYQGAVESVRAKGFPKPIEYHEILWHTSRFSVRPATATNLSRQEPAVETVNASPELKRESGTESPWRLGRVSMWNSAKAFGFVRLDEEDFYFNAPLLFRGDKPVARGDEVWFIPTDASQKNRLAKHVVKLGAFLEGKLDRVHDKGFGFVHCKTDDGELYRIFVFLGQTGPWQPGTEIEFEVERGRKNDFCGHKPQVRRAA